MERPEFNIPEGLTCSESYVVGKEHAASHVGSGDVAVLSTPSMIAFIEKTALNCVQKYLPPEYTTVGTLVNVRHLNPAPVGGEVKVEVKLVKIDGRRLEFQGRVYWKDKLIGEGTHERFIVNREKFLAKLMSAIRE